MKMTATEQALEALDVVRRAYRRRLVLVAATASVCAGLWFVVLFTTVDLSLRFPQFWCWTGWCVLLLLIVGGAACCRVLYGRAISDERIGVLAGALLPNGAGRLINVIQFSSSSEERERRFSEELLQEAPIPVAQVNGARLVPRWPLTFGLAGIGVALLLSTVVFLLTPQGFMTSLKRLTMPMAGIPPFSITEIVRVDPGDVTVVKGSTIKIQAVFSGVMPNDSELVITSAGGGTQTVPLRWVEGKKSTYTATTPALYEDTKYSVRGGDAESVRYMIHAASLPAVVRWTAQIQPPVYTGRPAFSLSDDGELRDVPVGSVVRLKAQVSGAVAEAALVRGGVLHEHRIDGGTLDIRFTMGTESPVVILLQAGHGIESEVHLPLSALLDAVPTLSFAVSVPRLKVDLHARTALAFAARDDYGVRNVELQQRHKNGQWRPLRTTPDLAAPGRTIFQDSFTVDPGALGLRPGLRTSLRLVGRDFGPGPASRVGVSKILQLIVPIPGDRRKDRDKDSKRNQAAVAELIRLQKKNLAFTREVHRSLATGEIPKGAVTVALLKRQTRVKELADALISKNSILGSLLPVLQELTEHEMRDCITQLNHVHRLPQNEKAQPLERAVALEHTILAALLALPAAMVAEDGYRERADLLTMLQRLVVMQAQILRRTRAELKSGETGATALADIVEKQDLAAAEVLLFIGAAKHTINRPVSTGPGALDSGAVTDGFVDQIKAVTELFKTKALYETMLTAAEHLQSIELEPAIANEILSLQVLREALKLMNTWRAKHARETLEKFAKTLEDISDSLSDLEKKQGKIAETTKDLTNRQEMNQEVRDELAEMDKEQKTWKVLIEKMAQDLYQFPELPVSNDLNAKMRQVFEDVEQAAGSEHAPSAEIAVQKEDSLLDAIKATKARVEDIEMWLPDVPDNIAWKMETFDAEEIPLMPLVELPDELEDIVGALQDQDSEIEEESQDATGNNMMADGEMGWDIMDGPMPSFSAKGKSGNMKPNDNEMTGRSGDGREGQANGELVENKVKGLEGRETHARRTRDPLQKGQVEEEEGSTTEARATGGGKLGGESENAGMFGNSPRRDLHMQPEKSLKSLRQETEALYTEARLLYLDSTQALGAAARTMRRVERYDRDAKSLPSLRRRVVQQLKNAEVELSEGVILPMPTMERDENSGGIVGDTSELNGIREDYRGVVSDYYRNLDK